MLKVEIRTKENKANDSYVIINGIADTTSSYFTGSGRTYAFIDNEEIIDLLFNYSCKEVGIFFSSVDIKKEVKWWQELLKIRISINEKVNKPTIRIIVPMQNWDTWAKPFSFLNFANHIEACIIQLQSKKLKYWRTEEDSVLNGFCIQFLGDNLDTIIKTDYDNLLQVLSNVIETTTNNLLTSIDKGAVLTYFQFPEEIKTACKQYLIYFGQFLADIGILADTEIKEELNHTLFKVIPKNENEGLQKIQEALHIYINAPNNLHFEGEIKGYTDVAVQQWESQVYFLKSQLLLARSIVQAKDAAIQAKDANIETLQISNYQLKQMVESKQLKNETDKNEPLIPGIVSVKKLEIKGFVFDLPEIFRKLKRIF